MKTKLDYMKVCLHQWMWLEEHPMEDKNDYFAKNPSTLKLCNGCAACQWTLKGHPTVSCYDCFLNYYAWHEEDYACEKDPDSPYKVWLELGDYTPEELSIRKNAAHHMVEAINLAIDDEITYLSLKERK